MTLKKECKTIAVLAISLLSNSVYAATQYSSEGHLSLEIVGFSDSAGNEFDFDSKPPSIVISNFDNSSDNNILTFDEGDAFSDAVSTPFSDSGLIDLDTQATGFSGNPYAFAGSEASALASFEIENTSLTDTYTVNMLLNYEYSVNVETDTPAAQQNGLAGIDIDLFGDFNLDELLAISISTDIEQGLFEGGETNRELSFQLAAGDFESIFANLSSFGESESISSLASVSEVPLPASIYLMGSALIGLFYRGKKLCQCNIRHS